MEHELFMMLVWGWCSIITIFSRILFNDHNPLKLVAILSLIWWVVLYYLTNSWYDLQKILATGAGIFTSAVTLYSVAREIIKECDKSVK